MLETTIHPPSDAAAKRTSAAAKIEVVDQTFRDAHQCLWATRMTTAHMLPGRTTMLLTSASASGGDGAGAGRAQRGTGTSTAIDVVHGERYRYVPDEVKKYALGYYGKLLAPVDPNVLDAIVRNGSPQIAIKPVPLEPGLAKLRKRFPNAGDDELALRSMFVGTQVDDMLAAGPMQTQYSYEKPMVRLVRELAARKIRRVYFSVDARK